MTTPVLSVSRRTRRTPFSPRVESNGVKGYTVYNHTLLATVFSSLEEDYAHLKEYVQIWDVSCERQVSIKGPDAARLVQLMTVRDVGKISIGQCFYAPLVDVDGGMVNDPVALKLAEDHFWLSLADSDVLLWARGLATGMKLDTRIDEPSVWPLAIQGPKADDVVAAVFGDAVRDIRFFRFSHLKFSGHPFLIARSGWSKQGGFEIYMDREDLALDLWDAIWEAGQPHNIRAGCPNHIERIEGGLLSYGNDMSRDHNPLECGLERYCDLDRAIESSGAPLGESLGESLGLAAVLAARDAGLSRQVRGLKIEGEHAPACVEAWRVKVGNQSAGEVTSAVFSPGLNCVVALAMMNKAFWQEATEVQVHLPDGARRAGTVTALPFV